MTGSPEPQQSNKLKFPRFLFLITIKSNHMKTFYLLSVTLAIACMISCSGDDPVTPSSGGKPQEEIIVQSVKVDNTSFEIGRSGGNIDLSITANCAWTITKSNDGISLSKSSGNGNDKISVIVSANTTFDTVKHTLTLSSQDKKSTAAITIMQGEGLGLVVSKVDTLKAEGGVFGISIKTNDIIKIEDLPEWIQAVESRALKDDTLFLNATANYSGSFRDATFVLKGEGTKEAIAIAQDSFDPTGIESNIPDELACSEIPYTYDFKLVPEYADWNKVTVTAIGGTVDESNSQLQLTVIEPGICFIVALNMVGDTIYSKRLNVIDTKIPTKLEIEMPDEICNGTYYFPYKVYPEGADISLIQILAINGAAASFSGDSIKVTISEDTFSPYVGFYINGTRLYWKDMRRITSDITVNINDGDTFMVGDNHKIKTNIPLSQVKVTIKDTNVAKYDNNGYIYFENEGFTDIIFTNKVSNKSVTVSIVCAQIHTYAKLTSANSVLFDYMMYFDVYFSGINVGPGSLYFENEITGSRILVTKIDKNSNYKDSVFKIRDGMLNSDWIKVKNKEKRYKLVFTGYINGKEEVYTTEWKVWGN